MLPTPEQAAPQPSTRSLIDQGEPLGLRLPRIALPLAQAFPSASLSTRPLIGSGPHCFHDGIGAHGQQGHRMVSTEMLDLLGCCFRRARRKNNLLQIV
jgi:hypothetical protein